MVDRNHPLPALLIAASRAGAGVLLRLTAVAATIALFLGACTATAAARARGCPYAHSAIVATRRSDLRQAVVCLVNQQRTSRHLPQLVVNARLNRSAQDWTDEMVSHRELTHGPDFASRISAVGFDWSSVGENIAGGFETPAAVVRGWMASIGHCQNILSAVYRMVGTGVSNGAAGSYSPGTWTQDFGLWMGQPPASGNHGPAAGCPYRS